MASYTDLIYDKEETREDQSGSEPRILRLNKGIPTCLGEKGRGKRFLDQKAQHIKLLRRPHDVPPSQ